MKESLVQQCLDILKREDIKRELNLLSSSVIEFILYEIKPYIYFAVFFVLSIFIINLTILIMLSFILTNKQTIIHKII
jgi:cellulose synthase/poly-beta-1,6-N-acetylglucosamine synthase-like glycosyltransferase